MSTDRVDDLINAALELVESRIAAGTATADETAQFLRFGAGDDG